MSHYMFYLLVLYANNNNSHNKSCLGGLVEDSLITQFSDTSLLHRQLKPVYYHAKTRL